jgi:hypothetical protein
MPDEDEWAEVPGRPLPEWRPLRMAPAPRTHRQSPGGVRADHGPARHPLQHRRSSPGIALRPAVQGVWEATSDS